LISPPSVAEHRDATDSQKGTIMSHDTAARTVFGVSLETITRRILRTFDRASKADVESGARWYEEAGHLADALSGYSDWYEGFISTDQAAVIIAHMSPRTPWYRNVIGATHLVETGERHNQIMGDLYMRALDSLAYEDPFGSFGPAARKTQSFARNISGDREAVTVDVWAARVADLDDTLLSRKGAYDAVAHAYRLAARRRGVDPATMQATTWIVARNGRAS
jgi:hypothetical protein